MPQDAPEKKGLHLNIQAYLLAGLLTITPLVVVWLVFSFFLGVLSDWGHPLAAELADFIEDRAPDVTPVLSDPTVQFLIAIAVALLMLYLIGAIASLRDLGASRSSCCSSGWSRASRWWTRGSTPPPRN